MKTFSVKVIAIVVMNILSCECTKTATRATKHGHEEATGGGAPQPAEMSQLRGAGLWSNVIVPSLVEAGALESPMAAGKKTIQRLKWLMIVVQFGPCATQQHGVKLGNELLMTEDFVGESDTDSD